MKEQEQVWALLMTVILSRLPFRTSIQCKCVCKSWLNLIDKSHLSKSVPALILYHTNLDIQMYKLFEFKDEPELEVHDLHYNPLTNFTMPYYGAWMCGSVDGLLFMCNLKSKPHSFYLCNPITREYISPQVFFHSKKQLVTYGFGVSRTSAQHKVVGFTPTKCRVYTLETGLWRRIAPPPRRYCNKKAGSFLFGNLHWLVFPLVSCFDIETEIFSTFSCDCPLLGSRGSLTSLVALRDCLCLCDNTSADKIVIWLMKVEKSWTKELVISKNIPAFADCVNIGAIYPIKIFENGDILMTWDDDFLLYHSKKNNTTEIIYRFDPDGCIDAFLHTPSFRSLKSFTKGDVISF